MRFGAHLSISGGVDKAARSAKNLGCEALQVFSRSPRGGKARKLSKREIERMWEIMRDAGVRPLVVHVPYLVNLASPDDDTWGYSRAVLAEDMERAATLGADYLVTHVGSCGRGAPGDGLERVARAIHEIVQADTSRVTLLLENTAGAGGELGSTIEEIAWLIDRIGAGSRVAVCLDTCHAHAAGYDLSDAGGVDRLVKTIDRLVGIDLVKVIHGNDSRYPAGSRRDRHEHIGLGRIGRAGFRAILARREFEGLPLILETPQDERGDFATNLQALRELYRSPS